MFFKQLWVQRVAEKQETDSLFGDVLRSPQGLPLLIEDTLPEESTCSESDMKSIRGGLDWTKSCPDHKIQI